MEARPKPCDVTGWRFGRWRPVKRIRTLVEAHLVTTNPETEIGFLFGGGAGQPGEQIVEYFDESARFGEHWFDFIWNVEIREILL